MKATAGVVALLVAAQLVLARIAAQPVRDGVTVFDLFAGRRRRGGRPPAPDGFTLTAAGRLG